MAKEPKEKFLEKTLHKKLLRGVSKVAEERLWQWLKVRYLGKGTERILFATLEQGMQEKSFWKILKRRICIPSVGYALKKLSQWGHLASRCTGLIIQKRVLKETWKNEIQSVVGSMSKILSKVT